MREELLDLDIASVGSNSSAVPHDAKEMTVKFFVGSYRKHGPKPEIRKVFSRVPPDLRDLRNSTLTIISSREMEVERMDTGCDMHMGELEWGRPLAYLVLNSVASLYVGIP